MENNKRDIKSVCIYCASSTKIDDSYFAAADELGRKLASLKIRIVNGAGGLGLMHQVTMSAMENGGEVVGVIPKFMVEQGWHNPALSEMIVTEDMHTRKQKMADMSDAVIALPGGCGTIEELMEIITWKQLGLYLKPIVILNLNSYYDPLLEMMDRAIGENFMREQHRNLWCVAKTVDEAIMMIQSTPDWDINMRKFAAI